MRGIDSSPRFVSADALASAAKLVMRSFAVRL